MTIPLHFGTPQEFAALRRYLVDVGFTEQAVCDRMGISSMYDFRSPRDDRGPFEVTDTLSLLIHLFLGGEPHAREGVRRFLPAEAVALMETLGVLRDLSGVGQDAYAATVLLYPTEGLYVVSDLNHDPANAAAPIPADAVYPAITSNTFTFLQSLPDAPCDSFLELCAGTGIAALIAGARYARQACAADITERSTVFARFNARLNGLDNVTAVQGDLYRAVEGETFDRIVAHPPYMPEFEQKYIFRDGGEDGEQITRGVVAGLPRHLRPGGRLYVTCMATDRRGAPLERRLRELLGEREGEFDVFVASVHSYDPTEYYCRLAAKGQSTFAEVDRRHEYFKRLGIERLVYASILIQRHQAPRATLTVRRSTGGVVIQSSELEWLLRWEGATLDPALTRRLLEAKPRLSPRARMHLAHRLNDGQWAADECRMTIDLPFAASVESSMEGALFLTRCDGTVSVRDHLQHMKDTEMVPADASEESFAEFVRSLVSSGLLEIAEFPLPQRAVTV